MTDCRRFSFEANRLGLNRNQVVLDNLSIIDENVSKMNELLEVLRVQDARIGLKINFKKTKFTMTLVTKKLISWAASLTLVVILVKTVGAVKRLKVE